MKLYFTIIIIFHLHSLNGQKINNIIKKGNDAYRNADYKMAAQLYKDALVKDPSNKIVKFNLGNALQKQVEFTEAEKYYDEVASSVSEEDFKAKAWYNKGVVEVQQQKLLEAIEAFKQSLMLNPSDNETRENLQKAINDLKKQQQNKPQTQKDQKSQPEKNKNNQPNQVIMEQKFNELKDKERELQKRLLKKQNAAQPDKDW